MNTELTREKLLLAAQRALLGVVTPPLRAVDAFWMESSIKINFVYDSGFSRNACESELRSEFETQLIADFPGFKIVVSVEELGMQERIQPQGELVYLRAN